MIRRDPDKFIFQHKGKKLLISASSFFRFFQPQNKTAQGITHVRLSIHPQSQDL